MRVTLSKEVRIVGFLWIGLTLLAAVYMPTYDFGFDAVKFWLALSLFFLIVLSLTAVVARIVMRHRKPVGAHPEMERSSGRH